MYKQRIELLLKSAIDEISFAVETTNVKHDLPALLPTVKMMLNDVQSGNYDDFFEDLDRKKASR